MLHDISSLDHYLPQPGKVAETYTVLPSARKIISFYFQYSPKTAWRIYGEVFSENGERIIDSAGRRVY
jgi:hypothetical protein